jgi:hypothetical protein
MRRASCLLAVVLATDLAHGQDQATTLAAMLMDAADIAQVRVLACRQGESFTVVFQTVEVIAGRPPTTFELSETAGAACGRALTGIAPGGGYVVFLSEGPRLAFATARAVVQLEPGLLAHLRDLRAAGADTDARLSVLAAGLVAPSPRVRTDAALTLAVSPGLERADSSLRVRLRAALESALNAGDPERIRSLTAVVTRTQDPTAIDAMLTRLYGPMPPQLRDAVTATLTRVTPDVLAARVRAVADPETRARATSELLPAAVARARAAVELPVAAPHFRSIDPSRRRR